MFFFRAVALDERFLRSHNGVAIGSERGDTVVDQRLAGSLELFEGGGDLNTVLLKQILAVEDNQCNQVLRQTDDLAVVGRLLKSAGEETVGPVVLVGLVR